MTLMMFVVVLQLQNTSDISSINGMLSTMDWLSLAGINQHVSDAGERDKLVRYATNWLCFGRTRPALERFLAICILYAYCMSLCILYEGTCYCVWAAVSVVCEPCCSAQVTAITLTVFQLFERINK